MTTTGLVVLANVIGEAFAGYPVTESVRAIERWDRFTYIVDLDCPPHMVYGLSGGRSWRPLASP